MLSIPTGLEFFMILIFREGSRIGEPHLYLNSASYLAKSLSIIEAYLTVFASLLTVFEMMVRMGNCEEINVIPCQNCSNGFSSQHNVFCYYYCAAFTNQPFLKLQFRAINNERGAFALCPGVKVKSGPNNAEHACVGGTSNHGESHGHCGDFASKDWGGYAANTHWASNKQMTESVVMIFYR